MTAMTLLGEPVLLGRDNGGTAFALRDICPHRGIPLSEGRFDGATVECRFHGWRFAASGRCTAIPALPEGASFDPGSIATTAYPVREAQGLLWVFFGADPAPAPPPPVLPEVAPDQEPGLTLTMGMPCDIDEGVFGLMDPTHNPFVHTSWWWRKSTLIEKEKAFAPAPYGFTMLPHRPSGNLLPYKLLGGMPETQLFFRLPSHRIEHTRFGRRWYVTLSTVTPTGPGQIDLTHTAYWNAPLMSAIAPLIKAALWSFTAQDRAILARQQRGLRFDPTLALVDDADTQARWYYRLKREYRRAIAENQPFRNPVPERTLRWRS